MKQKKSANYFVSFYILTSFENKKNAGGTFLLRLISGGFLLYQMRYQLFALAWQHIDYRNLYHRITTWLQAH